ncbi:hypothetical protein ACVIW2_006224 [Bradyrhizobium huanghuaihaiense]|jgi:hypothetical protein|uniref:Uncharacterized protein n=7 Tax=Bradyrhizobium TaxID=374 RepID=A0A2U8P6E5_9BRAD|nr:hypothetical protein BJS_05751 [Bradyrhizobium japonicum SEMIA 5079]AJA59051.1 hypothetical protein RN69_00320 [Bradyrhizobium japonicum]AND93182.1 hypothetical protein AAV28_39580 [Bradyrhizobium diazoefficiens USDA 110]APO48626.1 hypothetical protein BD122_00310 [Bradyrhizobium diazoefficiens]AWL93266.1 hypothetical protein CIT37_14460 [Bradyrhizobium ottawaense]KGJ64488.1 hypothetical protein BJA5080_07187 [Bradyrhizobium diazoefficiens SEMIA 5080]MBP1291797.1 hypothetical protein [Brad
MLDDRESMIVSCKDNGYGLGDDQLKAFLTKDTSYKDDLPIFAIGQCTCGREPQVFLLRSVTLSCGYQRRLTR